MSDLEQQASTWIPPWQRHAAESGPDFPPALPGDDFDELDEALGHNFVEDYEDGVDDGVEEHSGADADDDADADADDDDDDDADDDADEAATDGHDLAAAVAARLGQPAAAGDQSIGDDGMPVERIPDLAAAAGAMLAQSLASADAAAAQAKAERKAEEKAARAERQKRAKAKPVPEQRTDEPEADDDAAKSAFASEPPLEVAEDQLAPVLEAILMVVDEPVSEITLSQALDVPAEQIGGVLIDLSARYSAEGRGFDLRRAAGGWRFYTRTEYSAYVERFVLDGQQLRLTQASLETLAVVAYKQPVTRSRISAIRGVNCDGVIRTLVARGMIEECGTDNESGAHLYRTTILFLEKMGLDSVDQLPPLAPFLPDNLEELAASGE